MSDGSRRSSPMLRRRFLRRSRPSVAYSLSGYIDSAESEMAHRVFSGIQPTGALHIGNYLGAIRAWVELQRRYESFFCIVDYHAITIPYDPREMQRNIFDAAVINIAAGLDPNVATIFVQSHVTEHTELTWMLNSITPMGRLSRMTQFKEKSRQFPEAVNV